MHPFIVNKWTFNSMKLMNKLIQKVDIPKCLIRAYIKHLLDNLKEEKVEFNKIRLARLISFVVLNLLENEHINLSMIPEEIKVIFEIKSMNDDMKNLKKRLVGQGSER